MTMNAKTYSAVASSRPYMEGGFFALIFLSFRSCLSIIKTNNLHIRRSSLPPPTNSLCINKLRRIATTLCRTACGALFVPVCRPCRCPHAFTNRKTQKT